MGYMMKVFKFTVRYIYWLKSGSIAACFAANYISGAAPVSKRCSLRFCEGHFLSLPPWRGKRNRLTQ